MDFPSDAKSLIPTNNSTHHYRGQLEASEIFPYPEVLNEEQTEYLQMSIGPISKLLSVGSLPYSSSFFYSVN